MGIGLYLQVFSVFVDIVKAQDVRMLNQLHYCNFPFNLKHKERKKEKYANCY